MPPNPTRPCGQGPKRPPHEAAGLSTVEQGTAKKIL